MLTSVLKSVSERHSPAGCLCPALLWRRWGRQTSWLLQKSQRWWALSTHRSPTGLWVRDAWIVDSLHAPPLGFMVWPWLVVTASRNFKVRVRNVVVLRSFKGVCPKFLLFPLLVRREKWRLALPSALGIFSWGLFSNILKELHCQFNQLFSHSYHKTWGKILLTKSFNILVCSWNTHL